LPNHEASDACCGAGRGTLSNLQRRGTLTYVDLVGRLTDLEALAMLPKPGETCQQWSSYNRASSYDQGAGKYVRWDANGDGAGIIRKEGELSVFAQMDGPGVIWRIWSATADKGHVKIYLDGASEPAVDLPFSQYFDGTQAPFQGKALCHTVANGKNCYVPIPYQRSCKIVAAEGWGRYYHFTYSTFPKETVGRPSDETSRPKKRPRWPKPTKSSAVGAAGIRPARVRAKARTSRPSPSAAAGRRSSRSWAAPSDHRTARQPRSSRGPG